MKKRIYFLSILLVLMSASVPLYKNNDELLSALPPFHTQKEMHLKKETTYSGKDFGLSKKKEPPKQMYAKAYCLYDAGTGQILYGKNELAPLPMASTTKIMTCILALERGSKKDKVVFSGYAASMPKVRLGVNKGDTFYLKDLLYSLMLESHNDTAAAIAEHIGGSVENFAKLMNEKAKLLGCKNTHFITPNGLDANGHYTTAADLCSIAAYAIKNKEFLKIIKTDSHTFKDCTGKKTCQAMSHNLFLQSYAGALGIKTGFTGKAGYCFCGAAKRKNTVLITVVLASGFPPHKQYKWTDTKKLMDYGFENYKTIQITPVSAPDTLSVFQLTKDKIKLSCRLPKKITFTLSGNDTITHKTELPSHLGTPVRKGDIIGYEKYYRNHSLLYQFPIYAGEKASARNYPYYKKIIFHSFIFQK